MDLGEPERFVNVDVAKPGNVRLIEEPGFDAELNFLVFGQKIEKQLRSETFFQRFGAELPKDLLLVFRQVETAELSSG